MRTTNWTARLRSLPRIATEVLRVFGAAARREHAAWERRWHARATRAALRALDARTLRDLGIDHSEVTSIAGGVAGDGDPTRALSLQGLRGPSTWR